MERKKFNYANLSPREHYEMEESERQYFMTHITDETHPGLPSGETLNGFSLPLIREFHDNYHAAEK
jgi:hypothetical protein